MEKRFHILLLTTIFMLILWIWQIAVVHLADPHNLQAQIAIRQNPKKVIIYPKRGNIFTSDKQLLVGSNINYQIDLDITAIKKYCKRNNKNYETISDTISTIISAYSDISPKRLKLLLTSNYSTIFIDDDVSEKNLQLLNDELSKRSLPGLRSSFSRIRRTYPKDKLAARLLGMVGSPDNASKGESIYTVKGKCGIEKSFDEELSGTFGWKQTIFDAKNKRIPLLR